MYQTLKLYFSFALHSEAREMWMDTWQSLAPRFFPRGESVIQLQSFKNTFVAPSIAPQSMLRYPVQKNEESSSKKSSHQYKQARKLKRCATLRWNLRTAVKLAHSQNCRPQSRKKSKWNLCNCDCCKTCTETTANRRDGKHQRGYIQRSYSITQVGSTILPGRHRPFDTDMPRKRPFPSELF